MMESDLARKLQSILETVLKIPAVGIVLKKLQGDASSRVYFRLSLPSGKTFVVMKMPEGKSSASEEITNLKGNPSELPYVNIDRFLRFKGIPVPEIHYVDERSGILLLEDVGDETLEKRLAHASEPEAQGWYEKAIELLVTFQKKGMDGAGDCLAHKRSFDDTLFNWEFDHFVEFGIEGRLSLEVPDADLREIRKGTNFITFALTKLPQILVHRDFQSRNLMIQNENLRLLDFQDALMGPLPYDLVALLRDSYVALPWPLVSALIDHYLKVASSQKVTTMEPGLFRKIFDWMTIQRKLKDAGRFVYIDRVKGNPSFLKSIPTSLACVREAFERQGELKNLFEALKKYVPEFS